jgi:hypothetical protein
MLTKAGFDWHIAAGCCNNKKRQNSVGWKNDFMLIDLGVSTKLFIAAVGGNTQFDLGGLDGKNDVQGSATVGWVEGCGLGPFFLLSRDEGQRALLGGWNRCYGKQRIVQYKRQLYFQNFSHRVGLPFSI